MEVTIPRGKTIAAPVGLILAVLLAFLAHLATAAWCDEAKKQAPSGEPLTVYTAMTATTAQLPLLGAIDRGWPTGSKVKIAYWKNLEDLRALVLTGQGDVWVGHLETLARAASRGAPVSLVAVTVWRKFYFVSMVLPIGPGGATAYPDDTASLLKSAAALKLLVTSAPQNSPQADLLAALKKYHGDFPTDSLPPQQLILELKTGRRHIALLPEPMVSMAIMSNPDLKVIGSLEEEYSKCFGGPSLIPQAGVAVNRNLAAKTPEIVDELSQLMTQTVKELEGKPAKDLASLFPPEVQKAVGIDVLEASLDREPLIIKTAAQAQEGIAWFLSQAAPELNSGVGQSPSGFIWGLDAEKK
jgi:NitT/TauT family transport system substrate-binding protein